MVGKEKLVITKFHNLMHCKMTLRRERYGAMGWVNRPLNEVYDHLNSEIQEFYDAETREDKLDELVDIANAAMILHNKLKEGG